MTLGKYIRRLAAKLDPHVQWEQRLAKHNANRARPKELPAHRHLNRAGWVSPNYYGFSLWCTRRPRGMKGSGGKLLPRSQQ